MSERSPLHSLLDLHRRRERRVDEAGGKRRQARQTRLGRWNARERVRALVDPDTFVELGRHIMHRHADGDDRLSANRHPGDGIVAGLATVAGRGVAVYAHDPTVLRGTIGQAAAIKVCRLLDLAGKRRVPVICFADSEGARVGEGTFAMEGCADIMKRIVALRGVVPQLTIVSGLCVGAAAYIAALTDIVVMVRDQSFMFITGSKVARVVTGEDVSIDELGGAELHARHSGVCHAVVDDERASVAWIKRLLDFFAPADPHDPPDRSTRELEQVIPVDPTRGYDVHKVIHSLFDRDSFFELSAGFAPNLVTGLARLDGRAVAVLASQPLALAGALDVAASRKASALIDWSDARGFSLITLVDVPGYFPGRQHERAGVLHFGAQLIRAYASARVPHVCLILRKDYGAGSVLSGSAHIRLGLPTAAVGPMGTDAAVELMYGPELDDASDEDRQARARFRHAWREHHDNAWASAGEGYLDQIIEPSAARLELIKALRSLDT